MENLTITWRSVCFLIVPNCFLRTDADNDDTGIVLCSCGTPPKNFSVMPECVRNVHYLSQLPDFLVAVDLAILLVALRLPLVKYLGGYLMWNNASVYGERVRLDIFVRVWLDMWKYLERKYAMIFSVTLMCCEYMDVSLLTRI